MLQLMRTHMDYMERAKMLMGTDRIADMANSPRSRYVLMNFGFSKPDLTLSHIQHICRRYLSKHQGKDIENHYQFNCKY